MMPQGTIRDGLLVARAVIQLNDSYDISKVCKNMTDVMSNPIQCKQKNSLDYFDLDVPFNRLPDEIC